MTDQEAKTAVRVAAVIGTCMGTLFGLWLGWMIWV